MKATRRSFIEGTIAAVGAAFLPTAVCAAEEDACRRRAYNGLEGVVDVRRQAGAHRRAAVQGRGDA